MPTYDYACDACGHRFERWQQISESKLRTCPKCGKRRLQRLVGAGAGLIFKGSGFYVTDYKRRSGGAEKADAAGGGTGSGAEAAGTTGPSKTSGDAAGGSGEGSAPKAPSKRAGKGGGSKSP